ncbi:MAG: YfhO family protein [Lachnospiraceae bacterium]|nr:YfhO family protein [Lachnospiraceae bacterium]
MRRLLDRKHQYIKYSVLFVISALLIFGAFLIEKKNFLWNEDGLYQHFNAFVYFGKYIRGIVKTLIFEHKFEIPNYSFAIGYGGDIFTTLSYYSFGDPFSWLSVISPFGAAEYVFCFAVILRLYLAGIAFIKYTKFMGHEGAENSVGALMYAFCGYGVFYIIHPFFLNPMIYFPMFLIGLEKIFRGEKPVMFTLVTFISAISNYYFFYVTVLLTVIYALVRGVDIVPKEGVKNYIGRLLRAAAAGFVGVLMAGFVLVPSAAAFLGSSRTSSKSTVGIIYDLDYYVNLIAHYFTWGEYDVYTFISVSFASIIGIIAEFRFKSREKWRRVLFIVMSVFLLFPVFASVFNGFNYVINRWTFAYAFLICYLFVINVKKVFEIKFSRLYPAVLAAAVVGTVVIGMQCHHVGDKYIGQSQELGMADKQLTGNFSRAAALICDDEFHRTDVGDYREVNSNQPLWNTYGGTNAYWSVLDGDFGNYLKAYNVYKDKIYDIRGLDSRTLLLPFASAKYFTGSADVTWQVPYGYSDIGETEDELGMKAKLYKTDNYLPLGYTYTTAISESDLMKLTVAERQQVPYFAAILPDDSELLSKLEKPEIKFSDSEVPYKIDSCEDVEIDGNTIKAKKEGKVTITFDPVEDVELYLEVSGLEYQAEDDEYSAELDVEDENGAKDSLVVYAPEHEYYMGRKKYFFNLYYSDEKRSRLEIEFERGGTYTFEDLKLIKQPLDGMASKLDELKETTLQNVDINTDSISGTITSDEDKLLALSIPWSEGWSIYVDGVECEKVKQNLMYMAVPVTKGTHSIELKYHTPFGRLGCVITLIGVLVEAVWIRFLRN